MSDARAKTATEILLEISSDQGFEEKNPSTERETVS